MPRIRFTSMPKIPRDMHHLGYTLGSEHDVTEDQANRWLRRGSAEIVPDVAPDQDPEPGQNHVDIPDDWESLHHMARISLARRITDDPVESAAAADAAIFSEVERRTAPC